MDIKIDEVIFDFDYLDKLYEGRKPSNDLMTQFLESGYYEDNTLMINRFLDDDKTINLEKLELGIILAIENLEKSVKIENPVYVFLGNFEQYMRVRGIDNEKELDRIIEESSFILGFCQAIADEEFDGEIVVKFRGKDA